MNKEYFLILLETFEEFMDQAKKEDNIEACFAYDMCISTLIEFYKMYENSENLSASYFDNESEEEKTK